MVSSRQPIGCTFVSHAHGSHSMNLNFHAQVSSPIAPTNTPPPPPPPPLPTTTFKSLVKIEVPQSTASFSFITALISFAGKVILLN
ncbi:hypothetical protein MRB53_015990 [Persea americana]|uniref:Uncharacterized protein n=1 Tax=Persea americana TaxID=3435 RepID=A0ACC2M0K1_PERAE|nr:hypothetical protein MRB53_015990 [Persea americana]